MKKISITCGFCNQKYSVTSDELPMICTSCHCTIDAPQKETVAQLSSQCIDLFGDKASSFLQLPEKQDKRYKIEKELAVGGMGKILLVRDTHMDRQIAMKVLKAKAAQKTIGQRFIAEAKITAQLEHPNIIPIYDLDSHSDGSLYFTMKRIQGKSLTQMLKIWEKEGCSLPHRLQIFQKICHAVAYAHSQGILHRDLKPDNVMVGKFGEVLLIDWGIAKSRKLAISDSSLPAQENAPGTKYGEIIGTPGYMPPEQINGKLDQIDERSDVYGLGTILYQLLTLKAPFTGAHVGAILQKSLRHKPPFPKVDFTGKRLDPKLKAIILKAMAKEKNSRYTDIARLEKDIECFIEGQPVSARSETIPEKLARIAKINMLNTLAIGDLALLLLVFVVFGILLVNWQRGEASKESYKKFEADAYSNFAKGEKIYQQKLATQSQKERINLQIQEDKYWERALYCVEEGTKLRQDTSLSQLSRKIEQLRK